MLINWAVSGLSVLGWIRIYPTIAVAINLSSTLQSGRDKGAYVRQEIGPLLLVTSA